MSFKKLSLPIQHICHLERSAKQNKGTECYYQNRMPKMSWVKIPSCMEISSVNNGLPVFSKVIGFDSVGLSVPEYFIADEESPSKKVTYSCVPEENLLHWECILNYSFSESHYFKEINSGSDMSYLNTNYPVIPATFCRHSFWFLYSLWIPSCHIVVSFSCELSNMTLFTCHPCTSPRILLMTSTVPLPIIWDPVVSDGQIK